ncbi:hypothetical protein L3Q82_011356 [Scortum barcoo]|uniref:Uncharacterized protein n=1 Tax=Scortum barcoo TaxID=214431 RepID=A0ACB8WCU1_9TELE|nr:hypothetical protein L3Q82_011356 [Scortum barcoo]
MSDFRWIQTSIFLVLLHLTVGAAQFSSFTVRDEDEVTLPCENMLKDQDSCSRTTWLFSFFTKTAAKELKVTVEDVGLYTCRRLRSGRHRDTDVYLSLINMSEFKDADEVMLYCSVSTYGGCGHTMKWLYEGNDVAKDSKDVNTSRSDCSATVSFSTSHLIYTSNYRESFKCQVTDGYTGEVQLFPFSPQSSGEKPGKGAIPTRPRSSTPTTTILMQEDGCSVVSAVWLTAKICAKHTSCSSDFLFITFYSDVIFPFHGSYRLFCSELHHVGHACWLNSSSLLRSLFFSSELQESRDHLMTTLSERENKRQKKERHKRITMVEFKWIKTSLFLIALLQFTGCSALNYIMLVMRVAELVLITAITVLLIRAAGKQRPPDDNTVLNCVRSRTVKRSGAAASQEQHGEDEHEGVVNYENVGDLSASVRLPLINNFNINSTEK